MQIKVGDFGLATKLTHPEERKKTMCGTPNYIAPEILEGKDGHSFEVDIWSTGVILYTLLVGKPPYESKDVKSTYKRILSNSYTYPDDIYVGEQSKNLIRGILQLAPEKRLTLDNIFSHGFFNAFTPLSIPSSALREAPSLSQLQECKQIKEHHIGDENDPSLVNRMADNKEKTQNILVDKKPQPLSDRNLNSLNNLNPPVAVKSILGKQNPTDSHQILQPSARRAFDIASLPATAKSGSALPQQSSTSVQRPPVSAYRTTAQVDDKPQQKFDIFVDLDPVMPSKKIIDTNNSKKDNVISSKLSNNDKVSMDQRRFSLGNELDDFNEVNDDMDALEFNLDEMKLDAKESNKASSAAAPIEAWGVKNNGPAAAASKPAVLSTPTDTVRVIKELGTLETMHETLSQSFAGRQIENNCYSSKLLSYKDCLVATTWVVKYVDYTSKYGLGFLLNTGSAGVYFNDSTKIVLSPDGKVFLYVERRRKAVQGASEHVSQSYLMSSYPPELQKKVTLLRHFRNYLLDQNKGSASDMLEPLESGELVPSMPPQYDGSVKALEKNDANEASMIFLKKWVRTRHAILFRLSNRTVQVVFFDKRFGNKFIISL